MGTRHGVTLEQPMPARDQDIEHRASVSPCSFHYRRSAKGGQREAARTLLAGFSRSKTGDRHHHEDRHHAPRPRAARRASRRGPGAARWLRRPRCQPRPDPGPRRRGHSTARGVRRAHHPGRRETLNPGAVVRRGGQTRPMPAGTVDGVRRRPHSPPTARFPVVPLSSFVVGISVWRSSLAVLVGWLTT
jgi:hypothetical protein